MSTAEQRKLEQRKSSLARTSLVRSRNAGEPLRPPAPLRCQECCDMPWRRVDHLCKPGRCFGCGEPYEEETTR